MIRYDHIFATDFLLVVSRLLYYSKFPVVQKPRQSDQLKRSVRRPTRISVTTRFKPQTVIRLLAAFLIIKVTLSVVSTYGDYLPPDFSEAGFLIGRAGYFFGAYSVAFYFHIFAGPLTLLAGLILLSDSFRKRFTRWHRRVGRVQFVCVMMVSISGVWMSRYAEGGLIAGLGFGSLAIATGTSVWFGMRTAMRRRFAEHRRWMMRNYILLCSAVVLRLTAGITIVTGSTADWVYPMSAWTSWLIPLAVYETLSRMSWFSRPMRTQKSSSSITSPPETVASASGTPGGISVDNAMTLPSAKPT